MILANQYIKSVLLFYCYIPNYHKLCDLEQHPFIFSHFLYIRCLGTVKQDLTVYNQEVNQDYCLVWGEGSSSKLKFLAEFIFL